MKSRRENSSDIEFAVESSRDHEFFFRPGVNARTELIQFDPIITSYRAPSDVRR